MQISGRERVIRLMYDTKSDKNNLSYCVISNVCCGDNDSFYFEIIPELTAEICFNRNLKVNAYI